MTPSTPPRAGRRSSRRNARLDVTTVLAVVLPLLCAGALVLVRPAEVAEVEHSPSRTALTRAAVVCPTAMKGAKEVVLTSAVRKVDGEVEVGLGDDTETAELVSGRVTTIPGRRAGPVVVVGRDETAPGLVAARFGAAEPAAVGCAAPTAHVWFTGVGAGARHTSILELVNPDPGTAIAEVSVRGRTGLVDAPRLRGVSVPGRSSIRLDLGSVLPRRDELAIEVVASRGRLGVSVLDRFDEGGSAEPTQDWLEGQPEPATDNLLMGLAPGSGRRTLVVTNGTDSEVRAEIRVVTGDSTFAPEGLPEVRIAPQSTQRVKVSRVLEPALDDGATGLQVRSTGPVTATLRAYVDGDLSHAVPGDLLTRPATVLLPAGERGVDKTVELAGATRAGAVTVVSRSASGKRLDRTRVDIVPDRGVTVPVPRDAVLVTVTAQRTVVSGAVLVAGKGAAVLPLRLPILNGLIPDVRPGLP